MKNQKPMPSGCKDIWIRKFEFVAKTQFLNEKKINSIEKYLDSAPEIVERFTGSTLIPGQFLSLKCVGRGRPPPRFIWELDGFKIQLGDRYSTILQCCIKYFCTAE